VIEKHPNNLVLLAAINPSAKEGETTAINQIGTCGKGDNPAE